MTVLYPIMGNIIVVIHAYFKVISAKYLNNNYVSFTLSL